VQRVITKPWTFGALRMAIRDAVLRSRGSRGFAGGGNTTPGGGGGRSR
jgi:hypothetical protein